MAAHNGPAAVNEIVKVVSLRNPDKVIVLWLEVEHYKQGNREK
jgi:hypothetical protein